MSHKILVPIDFSDVTERVLDETRRMATSFNGKVWLIHVASPEPDFIGYEVGPAYIRDNIARTLREQHQQLQGYQDSLRAEGVDVTSMLVPGVPIRKILTELSRLEPDLIIMGSHGHGALYHLLTGSVAASVLKHATCPVLIVPSASVTKPEKVAAGKAHSQV